MELRDIGANMRKRGEVYDGVPRGVDDVTEVGRGEGEKGCVRVGAEEEEGWWRGRGCEGCVEGVEGGVEG